MARRIEYYAFLRYDFKKNSSMCSYSLLGISCLPLTRLLFSFMIAYVIPCKQKATAHISKKEGTTKEFTVVLEYGYAQITPFQN